MHVLIITFGLEGIGEKDYLEQVESIAPAFADVPGLVSKTWLANEATNAYGGFYVWQDREAMEAYKETDIYRGLMANPYFGDVSARDFAVLEGPTRLTRGYEAAAV